MLRLVSLFVGVALLAGCRGVPSSPARQGAAVPGSESLTRLDGGALIGPDAGSFKPSNGLIGPDAGSFKPTNGLIGPDAGSLEPTSGLIGPDAGSLKPTSGLIGPDAGSLSPRGKGDVLNGSSAAESTSCLARQLVAEDTSAEAAGLQQTLAVASSAQGVSITWSASDGALSAASGPRVRWTAPSTPGTFTAQATVTAPETGERVVLTWRLTVDAAGGSLTLPPPPTCP
ncbi:MAG: hypothetical protein VKS61_01245 [Candidatus Sericytochromatia bacterium]|nr:hypothetical protein [Candidatus Sericytochromatia bacterium]